MRTAAAPISEALTANAFVSSPDFQFAPYFLEVDFWFATVTGLQQLVHGTFMTKAAWRVRTSSATHLLILADAMTPGELTVALLPSASASASSLDSKTKATAANATAAASASSAVETIALKQWQSVTFDDVTIQTRQLTVCVTTPAWTVNVTSKPIYGLVPPLANATHVHGHWSPMQKRLDLLVHGAYPQPDAHGVIGQSYRDGRVRHGQRDEYGVQAQPDAADSDGMLPAMTTKAQAEGAIDGVYTDYRLHRSSSTDFFYSRFHRAQQALTPTTKRTASTSEWDGHRQWAGQQRE